MNARLAPSATVTLALAAVAGTIAFTWPLFIRPGAALATSTVAPFVFAAALPVLVAVVVTQLTGEGIDVKGLAMLGVLTAVGAALRPFGAGTAGLETVFFLMILAGRVFGPAFGFLLGTTTMAASALLTAGVGPWLPFQMLAAAFVGMGAGLLPPCRGRGEVALLAAYGFVVGFGYGWLMDLAFWPFTSGRGAEISYVPGATVAENLRRFVAFNVATSMAWNLGRALANAVLIAVLGKGILVVLRRAARRAAFAEPSSRPAAGSRPGGPPR